MIFQRLLKYAGNMSKDVWEIFELFRSYLKGNNLSVL